jgi:hypothetical protein
LYLLFAVLIIKIDYIFVENNNYYTVFKYCVMFRGSSLYGRMNNVNGRLWNSIGYSKLQWRYGFKTWSHSVPWKSGYEFYYCQKAIVWCLLATVDKGQISVLWFWNKWKLELRSCAIEMLIQTLSRGSDNDWNRYCSYSGSVHVVIKKTAFWSTNRELF